MSLCEASKFQYLEAKPRQREWVFMGPFYLSMPHAKCVTKDNRKNWEYPVIVVVRRLQTDKNCPTKPCRPQLVFMGSSILVELEFGNVGFCGGKKTRETRENPWGKARANNKLNTHRTLDQNRIWTTLVGGWSSRHCSTHAPTLLSCYCLVLICAWFPLHLTSNIASIIVVYFYLLHSKQTEPCCWL